MSAPNQAPVATRGLLLLLLASVPACAQKAADYRDYAKTVLAAETLFAKDDLAGAVTHYRQLFDCYDFVFARDAYNACQLAAASGDGRSFEAFFYQCAKAGVGKTLLLRNRLLHPLFAKDSLKLTQRYATGHALFLKRIDPELRAEFIARYEREQRSKGTPAYRQTCTDNFNRIAALAAAGAFPGERRIGPAESLDADYVVPTLCHYPYSYTRLLQTASQAVRQGCLQPTVVVYWYGFNQNPTSSLYTTGIPRDTVHYKAVYNFGFGYFSADSAAVDRSRRAAFLHDRTTQRAIDAAAKRRGIDYKDGA